MNNSKHVLAIPALPIIQNKITSLAPLFDGKRNDGYINLLTALFRGEKTQDEISKIFADNNIDIKTNPDFALFLSESKDEQALACASYIASSVLIEPNLAEFLEPSDKQPASNDQQQEFKINQERLTNALSTKMAIALANADIFTVIAKELQGLTNLTIEQYYTEIERLFSKLAVVYLQRVQQHYSTNLKFNLLQMQNGQFAFSCSNGYLFNFDFNNLTLKLSGITWYGNGLLLGKDYFLDVAYLPEVINNALA